jgi:TRAP-type C4-dicarboxylate transport system permease large subunit
MPAAGVAITDIFGALIAPVLILLLIAAIFVWACVSTARYNRSIWEAQMQEWRSLWICKACGQMFKPQSSSGSVVATQHCQRESDPLEASSRI